MALLQRKLYFSKDPEGSNIFQGGGGDPTFSRGGGGIQMLISIETYITCNFPVGGGGGGQTLYPPSGAAYVFQGLSASFHGDINIPYLVGPCYEL